MRRPFVLRTGGSTWARSGLEGPSFFPVRCSTSVADPSTFAPYSRRWSALTAAARSSVRYDPRRARQNTRARRRRAAPACRDARARTRAIAVGPNAPDLEVRPPVKWRTVRRVKRTSRTGRCSRSAIAWTIGVRRPKSFRACGGRSSSERPSTVAAKSGRDRDVVARDLDVGQRVAVALHGLSLTLVLMEKGDRVDQREIFLMVAPRPRARIDKGELRARRGSRHGPARAAAARSGGARARPPLRARE